MKPITDKMVEDVINKQITPLKEKADAILKDINKEKNYGLIIDSITTTATPFINKYLDYTKLENILYKMMFEEHIPISVIIKNSDHIYIIRIINESLNEGLPFSVEIRNKLKEYLYHKLIPEIQKQIEQSEQPNNDRRQKDNFLELIDKALSFTLDAEKEIGFLNTEELSEYLYNITFETPISLRRLEFTDDEILESLIKPFFYIRHENLLKDEKVVKKLINWLKFHVIPYIYENKENYVIRIKRYSQEITEERDNNGVIEHKHKSNDYWHPITRVHPNTPKNKLPIGHVTGVITTVKESLSEELKEKGVKLPQKTDDDIKLTIQSTIIKTVANLDKKSSDTVVTILSYKTLTEILHYRIYAVLQSFDELKEVSKLIIKDSIPEYITPEESELETIDAWFKDILIPKLKETLIISNSSTYNNKYQLIENLIIKELQKSIVSDLFRPMDLNSILYTLISEKTLSLVDIIHNPLQIEVIMTSSFIDYKDVSEIDKKEAINWLRKTLIPKVFSELQLKSPETLTSEIFSSVPIKLEIITKSQITLCIFPLNLNYISKEKFEQLPKDKNIVDILYTYFNDEKDLITGETIEHSDYIYDRMFYNDKENLEFSKEFKETIFQWLDRSVIPCIIKTINEGKPKDEYIPEFRQIQFEINKFSPLYQRMEKIVRDFYDSFYLPQHHLCLYYTYYVLRLKENHDFDFEFKELENKLYKDFYNYGIFACIGELRHFLGTFHYKEQSKQRNIEINDYIKYSYDGTGLIKFKLGFKNITTEISKCVGIDVKDIYKIINIDRMYQYTNNRYNDLLGDDEKENKTIRDTEFLYLIEKYFGYFTRPDNILKIASKSFNITKDNKSTCSWSESYGGEKWGSIAKTMLSRNFITSKTIFVDTCWSLQHNTNLFLDKVFCYNCKDNSLSLVKNYLMEIKDGSFKNVYACAIKHNNKLDRFVYRNIVLENDKTVPDAKYHTPEQKREPKEERETEYTREPNYEFKESEKRRRRTSLEKETINIVQFNDEQKYNVYKNIDNLYGLINAKINKLQSGWEDNPNVEIIIHTAPFRWIIDLNSITHYMNREHPFFRIEAQIKRWDEPNLGKQTSEDQVTKNENLIENIILDNINNLTNSEMRNIINSTIKYTALAKILQELIYQSKYTTLDLKEHIGILINNSLAYEADVEDNEKIELVKIWITDYLIPDLVKGTSLELGGLDVLFG